MKSEEKKQLFRQAACCALAGIIANRNESSENKDKSEEQYYARDAVAFADQLVKEVIKTEKIISRQGGWIDD